MKCKECGSEKIHCKGLCRKCYNRSYQKQWREKNIEERRKYDREWKHKHAKELYKKRKELPEYLEKLKRDDDARYFGGHRKEIIEREKFACALCKDKYAGRYILHHINGMGRNVKRKDRNNDIKNLIYLCQGCHNKAHAKGKKIANDTLKKINFYINSLYNN